VTRKGSKVRQKLETKQGKGKNIREEYSVFRGKCTVKRKIWERIIWRERRTDNMEVEKQ